MDKKPLELDINTPITIKKYLEEIKRTCAKLGTPMEDQIHMVMGIATEAGELLDAYKKNYAYKKPIDNVNIAEEIGDLMWYIGNLCNMLGFDFETILKLNVNKLYARYNATFSPEEAINRNLKEERNTLEKF